MTLKNAFGNIALDGTDPNGVTPPTGGVGIRGWLGGIYNKLSGTLATSRTWSLSSGSDSVMTVPSGTQQVSGTVAVSGTVGVSGPLTDAQLRATPVPVSGTVTALPGGTQAVSGTVAVNALPALPAGTNSIGTVQPNNTRVLFRDEFPALDTVNNWDLSVGTNDVVEIDGNAAGASYVKISKDPLTPGSETVLLSKQSFQLPVRIGYGFTTSQRAFGQEFSIELVKVDQSGNVITEGSNTTVALTGTVSVTSNVWTINTGSAHGFVPGDRVHIYGAQDCRLNAGAIAVTAIPSATQFTITSTLGNGTYTLGSNAFATKFSPVGLAAEAMGCLYDGTSTTNIIPTTKALGATPLANSSVGFGTNFSNGTIPSGFQQAGTYAIQPTLLMEMFASNEALNWFSQTIDNNGSNSGSFKRSQNLPDPTGIYKLRVRAKNLTNMTMPVAAITSISKAGSTTATVTAPSHGLTSSDQVWITGVADQTNFANLQSATAITVVDANTFTIAFGAIATTTSSGGSVWRINGSNTGPTVGGVAVTNISRAGGLMTVNLNISSTITLPGDSAYLHGMTGTAAQYNGRYKVWNLSGTVLTLVAPGADFGTITTGGSFIKLTDARLHFVRVYDHNPQAVQVTGGVNRNDSSNAVPVMNGATALSANISNIGSSGVSNVVDAAGANRGMTVWLGAGAANTDRASAVQTTSTNSGTIGDAGGQVISGLISVTANSGTGQYMDVVLQESYDNGTTWQDVWFSPRITSNTTFAIPPMILTGRRRWDYRLGGTSPSFTFSIVVMRSSIAAQYYRAWYDRSITPSANNSVSATWYVEGCKYFSAYVVSGVGAATPVTYTLQFSPDNANWFDSGMTLSVAASSNVTGATTTAFPARFARLIVKAGVASATQTYAHLVATS